MCICLYTYIHMKVLVTQTCLTLCDHMDCSPPGSSVHERLINVTVLKIYDQKLVILYKLSTESVMNLKIHCISSVSNRGKHE